jgi:hypothetical protein
VTGYNIYRSNISGSYESTPQITSSGIPPSTSVTYGPQASGTWYFIVKAYNAAGESPASNEVNATVTEILTPTGALTSQNTAPGNYTVTLTSISESGIANSSAEIVVTPDVGSGNVSQWIGSENLSAGSYFTITGMQPSTSYDVLVRYVPNNGTIASLNIVVGADNNIQVGQYVNYTVEITSTIDNLTINGTGFIRSEVIAVTSTNVTYNMTINQTFEGLYSFQTSNETTVNLTDGFRGYNLTDMGTNITITPNGTEAISTPWGTKICDRSDYTMNVKNGTANGTIWVYQGVLIKNEMITYDVESTIHLTMILTDTNLPSL